MIVTITAAQPADDEDCDRARHAAQQLLAGRGVDPFVAYTAYRADPDSQMGRHWLDALRAADVALTATWSDPGAEVDFDMSEKR